MKNIIPCLLFLYIFSSCSDKNQIQTELIVANGQMPNVVTDKDNIIHLVYGSGDSIMYSRSSDNAVTFSKPTLVSSLPKAYSFAMRGPQIAATSHGIVITSCNSLGDIYSFYNENGNWIQGKKVNDVDTVAKEGLMALGAAGSNVFAVWLDLRDNKRNKIYGARSNDGGKAWSKNLLIYASPDSTVCECCKPSVLVNGNKVYVMFRNYLKGNRDLYLVQSSDGGERFGVPQKLGNGSWKLDGCPMDGGALAVNRDGEVQTVWRRKAGIYIATPGMPEKEIGEGKGCTLVSVNNKNVYAWTEDGNVVLLTPQGQKKMLGKGSQPIIKSINNEKVICIWENEKQIHASVVQL